MVLIYWWLAILVCGLAIGYFAYLQKNAKKAQSAAAQRDWLLANFQRFTHLKSFQRAIDRYRLIVLSLLIIISICGLMLFMVIGRLANYEVVQPEQRNRDIMLCLDISGSMVESDAKVLEVFAKLAESFDGERIGLTFFDSSSVNAFPLTSDYDFVKTELAKASRAFASASLPPDQWENDSLREYAQYIEGVYEGQGSSLVGDGLASCVQNFDTLDTNRSRSVILATDNYVSGNPIVTIREAGKLAEEKSVRVYGINPADNGDEFYTSEEAKEYKEVVLSTGGAYYKTDDSSLIEGIVKQISDQEATRFKGAPTVTQTDSPLVIYIILLLGIYALYALFWRLKL